MKSAAMELGPYNITVNALVPGLVDTPLTRYYKRLSESMAETGPMSASAPIRRRRCSSISASAPGSA
jgi:NAD(P)-dependent dehydrogenase (short-subunit alcohol dehydrogenase family)